MTVIFFSEQIWEGTSMPSKKWENLKCIGCNEKLTTTEHNEFKEVKICKKCGQKRILLKKIDWELEKFKGDIVFKDCEYRKLDKNDELYCESKLHNPNMDSISCDNCKENIHLNCDNYVPKNDMCLQYFQLGISEVSQYDECAEKIVYSDKKLQQKWSN